MSDPDGATPYVGCSSHRAGGNDDDDDRNAGTAENRRKKQEGNEFRSRSKRVVLFPFTKSKKQKKSQTRVSSSIRRIGVCGCFCLGQPPHTLDSPKSNSSDTNDPSFTYDRLKTLIEKNDFFSKECDTHLL